MNEYDSSRMVDLLCESYDGILVEEPDEADLMLLNTCSIREKAQEKVFHQLGVLSGRKLRKKFSINLVDGERARRKPQMCS